MSKDIQKRNLLVLIVILVIISLLFIIFSIRSLISNSNSTKNSGPTQEQLEQAGIRTFTKKEIDNLNIYEDLDIVVNNLYDFVKVYKGDLETSDYTDYIKNLDKKFSNLYTQISNSNSREYFNNNSNDILEDYGIKNYTDFQDLEKYIEIYKTSGLTYKTVSLKKDTVEDLENYVKTTLDITYSNDITQTINISVLKDTLKDLPKFVISF